MDCTFNIPFSGNADTLVNNIRSKILAGNGSFGGDVSAGNFSISVMGAGIEGAYTVNGNDISIDILKKPFFLPCNTIRDYVAQNLAV